MFAFAASCDNCRKPIQDPSYRKTPVGDSLYWLKESREDGTIKKVVFCGPECSTLWTLKKQDPAKTFTPET